MDPLAHFLDGPRATRAFAVCLEMARPWAVHVQDEAALTVLVVLSGDVLVDGHPMTAGDLALVRGPEPYLVSDPDTAEPTILIGPGQHCTSTDGRDLREEFRRGVRRWGTAGTTLTNPDDTVLVGIYERPHDVGGLVRRSLPRMIVETATDSDVALVSALRREIDTDDSAGQVVIDRLLDLLVVGAVRRWPSAARPATPGSGLAATDPVVAGALRLLHDQPAVDWTVAALANRLHVSRATLAARFRAGVGEPPMSYLTRWRMTLAAGQLLDPGPTIAAIGRDVGYDNAFAFSAAFKRQVGVSPSGYRRQLRDGHRK